MKYLDIYTQWHCRRAGGLFFGIRIQFPIRILEDDPFIVNYSYTNLRFTFGLILFSVTIDVKYDYEKINYNNN